MMRGFLIAAAALAMAGTATQAAAQSADDLAGTWAFQTTLYGTQQVGAYMSGVAVMSETAPNRYSIRLLANERLVSRASGQTRLLTAHQTCTGDLDGEQFTVSCELNEPLEGYEPDNFILQRGDTADQLVGVLSSNAESQVTFSRMH